MQKVNVEQIQRKLDEFVQENVYVHLETTTGAYNAHNNENNMTVVAFIRNAKVKFSQAKIKGKGPYRVGLKTEDGWIYAEGITDYEIDNGGRLLMAGHDQDGKLAIALQISKSPFQE